MVRAPLKGVNRVAVKLATGQRVVYWYAWKGGPRLPGKPGDPEFVAAFAAAHAARTTPAGDTLAGLVKRYRAAPEFTRLADSTRAEWRRWLDRIELAPIASLSLRALNDPRVKSDLLDWRDGYADRPRAADYGAQVLSRVLSWAKGRGLVEINAMAGAETLHRADRADQIWTADEIARFLSHASPQVGRALRLACATGLRRGDLIALDWREVGELAIVLETRKSGKTATIPLIDDARQVLAEIGRPKSGAGKVLLNSRGKPWSADGLENRIVAAKAKAGVDKHLHDARGTFATRLRLAGLTRDEIASVMGWEADRVERLLSRYVDNERIIRHIAERLNRNESGAAEGQNAQTSAQTTLNKGS